MTRSHSTQGFNNFMVILKGSFYLDIVSAFKMYTKNGELENTITMSNLFLVNNEVYHEHIKGGTLIYQRLGFYNTIGV